MGLLKRHAAVATAAPTLLVDSESGLASLSAFRAALQREIARSRRHGLGSSLALFEVQVVARSPRRLLPPSPARFIAEVLTKAARAGDVVARIDETHFAVLLVEWDDAASDVFTERVRTGLCSEPYARSEGQGLYLRAWAGAVCWEPFMEDPDAYLRAAGAEIVERRTGPAPSKAP